jgi:hypothetical protein
VAARASRRSAFCDRESRMIEPPDRVLSQAGSPSKTAPWHLRPTGCRKTGLCADNDRKIGHSGPDRSSGEGEGPIGHIKRHHDVMIWTARSRLERVAENTFDMAIDRVVDLSGTGALRHSSGDAGAFTFCPAQRPGLSSIPKVLSTLRSGAKTTFTILHERERRKPVVRGS